uniref:Uncharacterized protein n=1 Tax=Setaria italica TaxID=4555 RepID=K3XTJ0_SETIT
MKRRRRASRLCPGRWRAGGGPAPSSCSRGPASRSAKSARLCKS